MLNIEEIFRGITRHRSLTKLHHYFNTVESSLLIIEEILKEEVGPEVETEFVNNMHGFIMEQLTSRSKSCNIALQFQDFAMLS